MAFIDYEHFTKVDSNEELHNKVPDRYSIIKTLDGEKIIQISNGSRNNPNRDKQIIQIRTQGYHFILKSIATTALSLAIWACSGDDSVNSGNSLFGSNREEISENDQISYTGNGKGTFTDFRDGQSYRVVTIGSQVWMAENLNYKTNDSYCYNDNSANCAKYGRLYSRTAAAKACPSGWHLPTQDDFVALFATHGIGNARSGTSGGWKLRSAMYWMKGKTGTNDFSFAALPAGGKYYEEDGILRYGGEGEATFFWTSTEKRDNCSYYVELFGANCIDERFCSDVYLEVCGEDNVWYSVRCVYNRASESPNTPISSPSSNKANTYSSYEDLVLHAVCNEFTNGVEAFVDGIYPNRGTFTCLQKGSSWEWNHACEYEGIKYPNGSSRTDCSTVSGFIHVSNCVDGYWQDGGGGCCCSYPGLSSSSSLTGYPELNPQPYSISTDTTIVIDPISTPTIIYDTVYTPQDTNLYWEGNSTLLITEISLGANWLDQDGDNSGWIEIYNTSDDVANLKGYALTDDLTKKRQWIFGEELIPSKSFRIVFCDKKNISFVSASSNTIYHERHHTNWELDKKGGSIYLIDKYYAILDSVNYPKLSTEMSWGIAEDGIWKYYAKPTPEQPNE